MIDVVSSGLFETDAVSNITLKVFNSLSREHDARLVTAVTDMEDSRIIVQKGFLYDYYLHWIQAYAHLEVLNLNLKFGLTNLYKFSENIWFVHGTYNSYIDYFSTSESNILLEYHGLTPPEYLSHPRDRLVRLAMKQTRKLVRNSKLFLVHSKFIGKELVSLSGNRLMEEDIDRFPNPIDLSTFVPGKKGKDSTPFKILFVGRVAKNKRLDVIIRAVKLLIQRGYNIVFYIVGNYASKDLANEKRSLDVLIESLNLGGYVLFVGSVPLSELVRYYQDSDVYCDASVHSSWGVPFNEAQACGTPVIAPNCVAFPEVVGDAGIFYKPLDHRELAEKIEMLICNEDLRSELSKKGLERVKEFSLEAFEKNVLKIARELE